MAGRAKVGPRTRQVWFKDHSDAFGEKGNPKELFVELPKMRPNVACARERVGVREDVLSFVCVFCFCRFSWRILSWTSSLLERIYSPALQKWKV